jgi:proton-dependent oligopeptide transporter, POT family
MLSKTPVNTTTEVSGVPSQSRTSKYLTAPVPTTKMPPGVPYIIGNEAAERFSFYGMRTILVVFMTKYLMNSSGQLSPMTDLQAREWFHIFVAAVYFFPLIGSIVADLFLGKYLTIMSLSIVYCLGHLALSLNDTRLGLSIGLTLIAIGSGGIKPCVSSNVGDQFGSQNRHLLSRVYLWFYLAINIGSAISMYWIPTLLRNPKYGPHVAFGVPGLLMFVATVVFWMGRKKLVHVPPARQVTEAFNWDSIKALAKLLPIFAVIAVFWSLYDQCSSAWVEQAEHMDLHFMGLEWTADQFQILNPILVLIYVPLFSFVIYPVAGKFITLTPLRKMSVGFFFTVASFLVPAWVESQIGAGLKPTIAWQILAYAFLMISEVMVYATGLEFTYAQAPKKMKSMVMALFLATNTAGNLFTAAVNFFIQNPDGTTKLKGANYYLFFAGLMFAAALCFIVIAIFYRGKTFIQDDGEVQPTPA